VRVPKRCLKHTFSYSKCVLQAILFLTVFSDSVSVSSKFDTAFLPDCTMFCSVFSGYWIGNLKRVPKKCLKHTFSNSKCVLQAILPLTVSVSSKFVTAFFADYTKFCSVFSGYWIRNLLRVPKKCLKQ